jgi:hypothetical protein
MENSNETTTQITWTPELIARMERELNRGRTLFAKVGDWSLDRQQWVAPRVAA